ncbi:MAG: hypothetical protein ACJA2S_005472, partial [Cyclobacteriaceae bacterium]
VCNYLKNNTLHPNYTPPNEFFGLKYLPLVNRINISAMN